MLSEEHKAVLLVVIGYRQKGGVIKSRVGKILGLEASSYLDDLLSQGLIYCDPSRELNFWRPTSSALLALGLRSHTDIPALKRARSVVRHAERNARKSETGSSL
jgi:chromosome segregation and condensation protein ScpB